MFLDEAQVLVDVGLNVRVQGDQKLFGLGGGNQRNDGNKDGVG